jgi:hypothetical protein
MPARAPRLSVLACVLAIAAPAGLAACNDEEQGVDEPAREGLSLPLDGVDYNVFITRELNPDITPDKAYVTEEAPPGEALYGVFLRACNTSSDQRTTVSRFTVRDNQDNTFEPEPLPEDNAFAYTSQTLDPEECIPQAGSVAQLGPTAGAMLLFQLPLENTENRPLELEVEADNGEKLTFELDI